MIFSKNFGDHRPPNTVCLFGVREVEEILYHEELSQVERLVWVPCVSRPEKTWNGFKGRVTDYLRGADSIRWTQTHFYLCGGGAMIDEVKAILNERGVQKSQIHQEIYYKTPKGDGVASEVTGT
jgi:NAD(P)H-flavin reductase